MLNHVRLFLCACALTLSGIAAAQCLPQDIDAEKELLITNTSVVDDPLRAIWSDGVDPEDGVWSFGRLAAAVFAGRLPHVGEDREGFPGLWLDYMPPWDDEIEATRLVREWLDDHLCQVELGEERPGMQDFLDDWEAISALNGLPETLDIQVCNGNALPPTCTSSLIPETMVQLLDFRDAPLRLLAIANRIDLRREDAPAHAGELRFVFCFLEPSPEPGDLGDLTTWVPIDATMILNYRVPYDNDIEGWATAWHALGESDKFDEQYKTDLAVLTEEVVSTTGQRGSRTENGEQFFNGGWLLRLRTNERAFHRCRSEGDDMRTEMGEFHYPVFDPGTIAELNYIHIEQTVDPGFASGGGIFDPTPPEVLTDYICHNQASIEANDFTIPLQHCLNGTTYDFQAGTALHSGTVPLTLGDVPYDAFVSDFVWQIEDGLTNGCGGGSGIFEGCSFESTCNGSVPTVSSNVRFNFAMASCLGCHGREAGVIDYYHIRPRYHGLSSTLSAFLTGDPPTETPAGFFNETLGGVPDPLCPEVIRLQTPELERRAQSLCDALPDPGSGF